MSLLREIQNDAISSSVPLDVLLRKCRVLASRLKNDELKAWVQCELDGYRDGQELPSYRRMAGNCYGHFGGPFGSGLRNAPIPESNIPKKYRDMLTNVQMRDGVGALELLVKTDDNLQYPWPAETSRLFGHEIYERQVLMQAWIAVPITFVAGILSTVRNRVLSFALEIEAQNPDAGEATAGSIPIPQSNVSQIFHTHIHGNVGNVSSGNQNTQTAHLNVNQGDFKSLKIALEKQGVGNSEIMELKNAIDQDAKPIGNSFGPKISSWIGKMISKAAEGTWKVTTAAAANLLTMAIKSYYEGPPQ